MDILVESFSFSVALSALIHIYDFGFSMKELDKRLFLMRVVIMFIIYFSLNCLMYYLGIEDASIFSPVSFSTAAFNFLRAVLIACTFGYIAFCVRSFGSLR